MSFLIFKKSAASVAGSVCPMLRPVSELDRINQTPGLRCLLRRMHKYDVLFDFQKFQVKTNYYAINNLSVQYGANMIGARGYFCASFVGTPLYPFMVDQLFKNYATHAR